MSSILNIITDVECEILIQGKNYGKSPKKVVVNPGFLIVTLVSETYGKVTKEVEIMNGDVQNVFHNFS